MCFSAEASYAAAAVLLPSSALAINRARKNRRYLAFAALPLFFGLQQLFEGLVWTAGNLSNANLVQRYSLTYMFFS